MKLADKLLTRVSIYPIEHLSKFSLQNLLSNVDFVERIYFCSKILYKHIQEYKSGKIYSDKELERLHRSLYLYYMRMCSRSTPFEVTATYSFGEIVDNKSNKIIIDTNASIYKIIDYSLIAFLSKKILSIPVKASSIRYKANPTLRRVGDFYQYIEYKDRNYNISRINIVENLDKFIEGVNTFCTVGKIQDILKNNDIIRDKTDLEAISCLIENKILISELEYCLYDKDFQNIIIKNIEGHSELTQLRTIVDFACRNTHNLKDILSLDKQIRANLSNDNMHEAEDVERFFSINLKRDCVVLIDEEDIKQSFIKLSHLFKRSYRVMSNTAYDTFKKEFEKRYESAKIPLLEALDPVIGLGYPVGSIRYDSELLEGLKEAPKIRETTYSLSDFDKFLIHKITRFNTDGNEVVLDSSDFNLNNKDIDMNHKSITICVQGLKKGDNIFFYYNGILEDNNMMLIRYSSTDKEIRDYLQSGLNNMSGNRTVDADILYKTDSRIDNLLLTEPIHKHVINCLCEKSSNNGHEAIELNDLSLFLEDGELRLWCVSKGVYVTPHMNGVYNYELSDVCYYRFLSDFANYTNKSPGYFAISPILYDLFLYIPRVKFENIILLAACWKISMDEIIKLADILKKDNYNELVESWRKKRKIPPVVLYRESDKHIYINWSERISICAFLKSVKKKEKDIWVHEFLYDTYDSLVCDKDNNHYVNELFICIKQ